MLAIKQKFHLSLPHMQLVHPKPLQFSSVQDDGDDLTQAIVTEPERHDDTWRLEERPAPADLEQFWSEVEDDILHDKTWFKFDD